MRKLLKPSIKAARGSCWSSTKQTLKPEGTNLDQITAALEEDSDLLELVVSKLPPEHRRRLVITGGAIEWFGKDHVAKEIERADFDNDHVISPKDFDHWFTSALKRRSIEQRSSTNGASGPSDAAFPSEAIPFVSLCLIALEAGLPFVGFGFLDNATMILSGDMIDHTLGFYLNLSVMASAAMGNIVSGVMGMQVHGLVEKAVQKLDLKIPTLSETQRKSRAVFLAGHIGGTIGIMLGLTLGMLPLLFISAEDETRKSDHQTFVKWDANRDGVLEESELRLGLQDLGFSVDSHSVLEFIRHHSRGDTLDFNAFHMLCNELRSHQPRPQ